jgi:hypothetical protein
MLIGIPSTVEGWESEYAAIISVNRKEGIGKMAAHGVCTSYILKMSLFYFHKLTRCRIIDQKAFYSQNFEGWFHYILDSSVIVNV